MHKALVARRGCARAPHTEHVALRIGLVRSEVLHGASTTRRRDRSRPTQHDAASRSPTSSKTSTARCGYRRGHGRRLRRARQAHGRSAPPLGPGIGASACRPQQRVGVPSRTGSTDSPTAWAPCDLAGGDAARWTRKPALPRSEAHGDCLGNPSEGGSACTLATDGPRVCRVHLRRVRRLVLRRGYRDPRGPGRAVPSCCRLLTSSSVKQRSACDAHRAVPSAPVPPPFPNAEWRSGGHGEEAPQSLTPQWIRRSTGRISCSP